MSNVVLVDNSAEAFCFHPENGVLVRSWFSDAEDAELPKVLRLLHRLRESAQPVQKFLEKLSGSAAAEKENDLPMTAA